MVDGLGPLARTIAVLRQQLQSPTAAFAGRREGASRVVATAAPGQTPRSQVASLASRLAVLPGDDPLRKHKALRLFVEAVLLDEFGSALALSAEFAELVDKAVLTLEASDETRELVVQALTELLPAG